MSLTHAKAHFFFFTKMENPNTHVSLFSRNILPIHGFLDNQTETDFLIAKPRPRSRGVSKFLRVGPTAQRAFLAPTLRICSSAAKQREPIKADKLVAVSIQASPPSVCPPRSSHFQRTTVSCSAEPSSFVLAQLLLLLWLLSLPSDAVKKPKIRKGFEQEGENQWVRRQISLQIIELMGSGNSKGSGGRSTSFRRDSGSGSSSRADRYPEARPYPAPSYSYPPQSYPSPSEYHGSAAPTPSYSYPSQSEYHGHAAPTPSYSYPSQSEYHGHAASRESYSYPSQSEYHGHATPTQRYSYPSQSEYHNHASSTESYSYAAPSESYAPKSRGSNNKLQRRYSMIADNYHSLDEVTADLAKAGLESSNLIVGIDFTKSNEWTGARSFNRRSLHHIGDSANPYEQAISIIGRTLSAFDEDNLIPCFGFGDASTHDQDVFSFYPDERSCSGFEEALRRYREIVPHLRLAGPTSFAPIIEMAMTIVEQSGGQYHVLLIIADGQVTRSVDTEHGHLSPQEQNTVDAIVRASEYPLSIVLVGVGDGPWDMMKEFDDNIPARAFDNFQFVNFTEIMSKIMPLPRKEMEFALAALMEIPAQYKATIELRILGRRRGKAPDRVPLPPPIGSYGMPKLSAKLSQSSSFQHSPPHDYGDAKSAGTAPPASSSWDIQVCPICLNNPKDMAFGCGHQTCRDCGSSLTSCPICRSPIDTRIKLY